MTCASISTSAGAFSTIFPGYQFGDLIGLIAGKIEFATSALVGFDHDADLARIERRVLKQTIDGHDTPSAHVRAPVGPNAHRPATLAEMPRRLSQKPPRCSQAAVLGG